MSWAAARSSTAPARRWGVAWFDVRRVDDWTQRGALLILGLLVGVSLLLPLMLVAARAVTDDAGRWVGLDNFRRYLGDRASLASVGRTLAVGTATTAIVLLTAFVYAYAIHRSRMPGRRFFAAVAQWPLYAPGMLFAFGLIYLLGRQGLLTTGGFDLLPIRIDAALYGLRGIVIAEAMLAFPVAVMVLGVALRQADARLYEAAEVLGASRWQRFRGITLPACCLGLASAASITFIMAVTDFGVPKVLGGQSQVMAVDVYQQVVGQHNFSVGAAVSVILLFPSIGAFALDRWAQRRATVTAADGRALLYVARARRWRDRACFAFCTIVVAAIGLTMAAAVLGSVVRIWPYSLSHPSATVGPMFTLDYYHPSAWAMPGTAANPFLVSLLVAAVSATVGTPVSFVLAYLIERAPVWPWLRGVLAMVVMLPLAMPGLVLGFAYILAFGRSEWFGLPNPLTGLYGTTTLLAMCNVVHFAGVAHRTCATAVAKLNPEMDSVAATLAVSRWRVFTRVAVPVCLPALLQVWLYYLVSAMTTVSAVVFLYTPRSPLASVAAVNLDDAGLTQAATAVCVLIFAANLAARGVVGLLMRFLGGDSSHAL